jgi:integrase
LKTIEEFLSLSSSESTKKTYRAALNYYFNIIGVEPSKYFEEKRDYESDVEKFFQKISEDERPPKTIFTYLSAVKCYLLENNVELNQRFWRKLRLKVKGRGPRSFDEVPSDVAVLRKILLNMDLKGKALFLTLASSGMRIGEALQLELDDIDLTKNPPYIYIRGLNSKTGEKRISFISSEAKEALEEWLKQRKNWLESSINKGKGLEVSKSAEDNRIFPFSENIANVMWNNALEKAGLTKRDKETGRRTLHPHILRKWFRTRLGKINPDYTEAIMGHTPYLEAVYRRYGTEELANFYLENQHLLYIFTDASELSRLRNEVDNRIKSQGELIEGILLENIALKKSLNELQAKISEFEKYKEVLELLKDTKFQELIAQFANKLKE